MGRRKAKNRNKKDAIHKKVATKSGGRAPQKVVATKLKKLKIATKDKVAAANKQFANLRREATLTVPKKAKAAGKSKAKAKDVKMVDVEATTDEFSKL